MVEYIDPLCGGRHLIKGRSGGSLRVVRMLQKNLETLVREILSDTYVSLGMDGFSLTENVREQSASIAAVLINKRDGATRSVEGRGVGMVDALFTGLTLSLSSEYPSLEHIHFVDFKITSDFDHHDNGSRSDASLKVCAKSYKSTKEYINTP